MSLLAPERLDPFATAFAELARDVGRVRATAPSDAGATVLAGLRIRRELRPLLDGVSISPRPGLPTPVRVAGPGEVEIDAALVADEVAARVHLRHGLELALLHRVAPDRSMAVRLAAAILAAGVCLEYLEMHPQAQRESFLRDAPPWLRDLRARVAGAPPDDPAADRSATIATAWLDLLPLQSIDPVARRCAPADIARAIALARDAAPAALPTARLLTLGGDTRLDVDPRTGLNKYGCSPKPRPEAITFSSCTASSSSDLAFDAAERARQALLADAFRPGGFLGHFAEAMESLRDDLAAILRLDRAGGTEIIFSPSGTDVELYALHFAMSGHDDPVLNIVVAPREIGSGSLAAAQGLGFSRVLPLGGAVEPGAPVRGIDTARVRVACVEIRDDASGALRDPDEVDAEVARLVDEAVARGERVLLHLLDSSKTGSGAPGIGTVQRLRLQHFPRVSVLVDAAQMRLSVERLGDYLDSGFMVIVSGSKFFTGAPFSGALVVPPAVTRTVTRLAALPEGFGDYLSRYDIGHPWRHLRYGLPDLANVGLHLRWRAALWEMQAFDAVPPERRRSYLESFAASIRAAVDETPFVEWIESPVMARGPLGGPASWDQVQSIFSFLVMRRDEGAAGGRRALTHGEAERVYAWLNRDISGLLPEGASTTEITLAAQPCHIGQPVSVRREGGDWIGALRIAPGARLVSRVHFDPLLGPDPTERLAQQVRDARVVLAKIGVILRYWEHLARG